MKNWCLLKFNVTQGYWFFRIKISPVKRKRKLSYMNNKNNLIQFSYNYGINQCISKQSVYNKSDWYLHCPWRNSLPYFTHFPSKVSSDLKVAAFLAGCRCLMSTMIIISAIINITLATIVIHHAQSCLYNQ